MVVEPTPTPKGKPPRCQARHRHGALGVLELMGGRDEADVELLVEGGGDALEHGERMPFVVGVLQPGDDRLSGADLPGQFALGEAGRGAQGV